LTVNNDVEIDGAIDVAASATMNWPTRIEIGAAADITVDANISQSGTTITYNDDYAGVNAGKIESTGTMSFSTVKAATGSTQGGSLKATAITIGTYGSAEDGVDVAFDGPTTITNYRGYGNTYIDNGDLTITNYQGANPGPDNEITSPDSDVIFNGNVAPTQRSLQMNVQDIYLNAGIWNKFTGSPATRLIANNVYVTTELKSEGSTELYIEANVIQQSDIAINQNSAGNIYIKNNYDSNGYITNYNNTNATFKIEGNAIFDNISGHLNSSANIIVLGNATMAGGTFGPNDGSIYVGGYMQLDNIQISFQGSAKGYIGTSAAAADFTSSGMYSGSYDATTTIGGSGNHLRDASNNPSSTAGLYVSVGGGQITDASKIDDIANAAGAGLDVSPEVWALPIELVSFSVEIIADYAQINWVTATEDNNDYFTVYRSFNGIDFYPIEDMINGAGNSSQLLTYNCIDENVICGTSYYKLSQTDFDGKEHFSPVIVLQNNCKTFTLDKLFTKQDLSILEVNFEEANDLNDVKIYNINGWLIYQQVYENVNDAKLYLKLPKGTYILFNQNSQNSSQLKFIVN